MNRKGALLIWGLNLPATAPVVLSPCLALTLLWAGWSWVPSIFAVLLLPLLFPTGRPPSPRWRWVLVYALALAVIFFSATSFIDTLVATEGDASWSIPNPIGFILVEFFESALFFIPWSVNLVLLTLLSLAALVHRYRRARSRERQQIKLLMYACAVLTATYIAAMPLSQEADDPLSNIWAIAFGGGVAAIPVVINYSILRYRLFDIDLVIRRTLVYAIVTALLAFVFYGGVILLQRLFTGVSGQQSPIALVASTLVIAALFSPLRRRIQDFVDRRFYRRKYDAQQVLAQFAIVARDKTDVGRLAGQLGSAVEMSLRPTSVGVWVPRKDR